MNKFFNEIHGNFGFGCMRLPMVGNKVDQDQFNKMIDYFIANGFNYFDTARVYIKGQSETSLREGLVKRYPRESFILTDKLSNIFNKEEDIVPLFESQLESCGVSYFDFYLMHAQTTVSYAKYMKCNAYKVAYGFKKEGKIKHFGISFHDKPALLEQILTEHPEIEIVQIQLNYIDWEDAAVESKLCYEVCVKHHVPCLVMEPVKGGSLVNLPEKANEILRSLNGGSNASYAIRFAASLDNIAVVLSGMSNMEQMKDNVSFMKDFKPLNKTEYDAINEVCKVFKSIHLIPCTGCRYCVDGCPKQIPIPDLFACMNSKVLYKDWNSNFYYETATHNKGKALDCIKCGKCERSCPQHLLIRDLLVEVSKTFD